MHLYLGIWDKVFHSSCKQQTDIDVHVELKNHHLNYVWIDPRRYQQIH